MNSIAFGQLLEQLLHLSKQKKSTLARELGYDISYISKWINAKNLPTQKNISAICKSTAEFVVKALTPISTQELIDYFEMDTDIKGQEELSRYLEKILKESYISTAGKGYSNIHKSTHSEDNYNSIIHINPRLRKQYLAKDAGIFTSKSSELDLIMSANLYKLNNDDKMAIADMKSDLAEIQKNTEVKVKFLMGFEGSHKDIIFNTILIINMITTYPDMNFEIYNCDVDSNAILSVIKDRIFHGAVFAKDRRCLFTNMSKEKDVIDEMYYSLENILKNQGKLIFEKKDPISLIKDKTYIQYIMGQDLRWLIGSMSEFFMPYDLFMEVGENIFGNNPEILQELKEINIFLQNVTYVSKLKVLIYESELRRYISSGELKFFNIATKLTLEQRERHIRFIEKILSESKNVEIKLVDGHFVEDFKYNADPSLYLSKTLKLVKTNPTNDVNDYVIIKDNEFKHICDELFEVLWNKEEDIVIGDKEDILEKISKSIAYTRIINGDFKPNLDWN